MVFYTTLFVYALFALKATAAPTRRAMVIHESRDSAPEGFSKSGTPGTNATVNLRIALTSNDLKTLETKTYDVSTPGSANYGKHLTKEEVQALAGPTTDSVSAVTKWLNSNGIQDVQSSGAYNDWLTINVPVSQANSLINANFQTYTHDDSGETLVRTLAYSVPKDIQPHVALIHPTTAFIANGAGKLPVVTAPVTSANLTHLSRRANSGVDPNCDKLSSPACLFQLYGIPSTPAKNQANQLAVSGFLGEFAQNADLQSFLQQGRPDVSAQTNFSVETLDGGQNLQGADKAGTEANLDIQYTVGVATGVPTTFVSVGAQNQDGVNGFLDIINFLNAKDAPPNVLTTSYGFNEPVLPQALAQKLCSAYMALGARGVSILFSSGDGGVSGSQASQCSKFVPTFPSGCPFVTSVGSTHLIQETAANFSSGGFSDVFQRPSFQDGAVNGYLKGLGNTNKGLFNVSGRGFPDVSTQGQDMAIVNAGQTAPVSGTSASSPIFASVISLINDQLITAGKPQLGFLNPFLYANPSAFFDVTTGSNPGCNTDGFPASTGWDPVTGLGTPNFAALSKAAGL